MIKYISPFQIKWEKIEFYNSLPKNQLACHVNLFVLTVQEDFHKNLFGYTYFFKIIFCLHRNHIFNHLLYLHASHKKNAIVIILNNILTNIQLSVSSNNIYILGKIMTGQCPVLIRRLFKKTMEII
mgnify:CR=1 FL=1